MTTPLRTNPLADLIENTVLTITGVVGLVGLLIYDLAFGPIVSLARRTRGLKDPVRLAQASATAFRLAKKADWAHKLAQEARSRSPGAILGRKDNPDLVELLQTDRRIGRVGSLVLMPSGNVAGHPENLPIDAWERYASPSGIEQALDQIRQLRRARRHYRRARRSYRSASISGPVETHNRGCEHHRAGNVAYLLALDGLKLSSFGD